MAKRQLTLFGTDAGPSTIYTNKPKNNVCISRYMSLEFNDDVPKAIQTTSDDSFIVHKLP